MKALRGLVFGCLIGGAAVHAAEVSPEDEIAALLQQATNAESLTDAHALAQQAVQRLDASDDELDELATGWLRAEARRTAAEIALRAWREDPTHRKAIDAARRIFTLALSDYESFARTCQSKKTVIERDIRVRDPAQHPEWQRANGYRLRALYATAWVHYTLGSMSPEPRTDDKTHLEEAARIFSRHFTSRGYRSDAMLARCVLSHAQSLVGLGRPADALALLKDMTVDNTPADALEQVVLMRVRAMSDSAADEEIDTLAAEYFQALDPARFGRPIPLQVLQAWVASVNRRMDIPSQAGDAVAQLTALARRVHALGRPAWRAWAVGMRDAKGEAPILFLARAEGHSAVREFEQAIEQARAGLAYIDSTRDAVDETLTADLTFVGAASAFHLQRWVFAYELASQFVKNWPNEPRVAEMLNCALSAGAKGIDIEPGVNPLLYGQFVDHVVERFPDLPEAVRAPWYRAQAMLKQKHHLEAIEGLESVPPESPIYRRAQYGLLLALLRRYEDISARAVRDTEQEGELLTRAVEATKRFFAAATGDDEADDHEAMTRAVNDLALQVAEALLDRPDADAVKVDLFLSTIDVDGSSYRRALQCYAALLARDVETCATCLAGGSDTSRDTSPDPKVLAAFGRLVTRQYRRLEAADDATVTQEWVTQTKELFELLLAQTGDNNATEPDAPQLATTLWAARLLQDIEESAEAARLYERLIDGGGPAARSADVLLGLARAYKTLQRYDDALPIWQKLARGLKPHTATWYESRYEWIASHHAAGRVQQARRLLEYFKLQYPDIQATDWRLKFADLDRKLPRLTTPPENP